MPLTKTDLELEVVFKCVLNHFELTRTEIMHRTRKRVIVEKRQMLFYLCRKVTGATLELIGSKWATKKGFDHTTVLHACKTVSGYIDTSKEWRELYSDLNKIITIALKAPINKDFLMLRSKVFYLLKNTSNKDQLLTELLILASRETVVEMGIATENRLKTA